MKKKLQDAINRMKLMESLDLQINIKKCFECPCYTEVIHNFETIAGSDCLSDYKGICRLEPDRDWHKDVFVANKCKVPDWCPRRGMKKLYVWPAK
jgi:hypothetical protein